MLTPQLGNCPKCGKLFLRTKGLCEDCYQKQEDDYLTVSAYLREHPRISIQELSDATKVSVDQIRQFIWAKRILVTYFPNLSYPCKICGNMIRTGKACPSCTDTINKLANQVKKDDGDKSQDRNGTPRGYISRYL